MGPKKGKSKGNSMIDGVDTSTMSREQLEAFAHRLRNEMEREREERNFFQMERDKLRTFWEISKNQLDEVRKDLKKKEREVEAATEMAELDIKNVMQQMKHLQYENQTRIGEIRAENMTQLKLAQEDHGLQELELLRDKRELREALRENSETTELQIQQLKIHHANEMSVELARFERDAAEMQRLHKEKLDTFVSDSEICHRMEMFEVEERKNDQIRKLIAGHDKAFNEMKNYYNDISLNNIGLICSLKEQMEVLRKDSEEKERSATHFKLENRKLMGQLSALQSEVEESRKKLEHFNRDRLALQRNKMLREKGEKRLNDLRWETEALSMRCVKLTEERDEFKDRFEQALLINQRCAVEHKRKLNQLEMDRRKREEVVGETLAAAGIDTQGLGIRVENLFEQKNELIQELRFELAKTLKAHDDMLATYEAKLAKFGIPVEELGFEPLRVNSKVKYGHGPAGLVAKK